MAFDGDESTYVELGNRKDVINQCFQDRAQEKVITVDSSMWNKELYYTFYNTDTLSVRILYVDETDSNILKVGIADDGTSLTDMVPEGTKYIYFFKYTTRAKMGVREIRVVK